MLLIKLARELLFCTNFIFLPFSFLDSLSFIHSPDKLKPQYVNKTETILLTWMVKLTAEDLNSRTEEVWFRLEKLLTSRNSNHTTYLEITPFRKIASTLHSFTNNAYAKRIKYNQYEVGFYLTHMRLTDTGRYRLYIRTSHGNMDYFSFAQRVEVIGKCFFVMIFGF